MKAMLNNICAATVWKRCHQNLQVGFTDFIVYIMSLFSDVTASGQGDWIVVEGSLSESLNRYIGSTEFL